MKSALRAARRLLPACALALAAPAAWPTDATQDAVYRAADFEQHLDRALPSGLAFRDDDGAAVRLADLLGAAPVALLFSYYHCTNLCPSVIRNFAERLAQAQGPLARRLQIVVVSVDPLDTPALARRTKHQFLDGLVPAGDVGRWHFLSGQSADIAAVADAAGFRYGYDAETHQYAHPAGVVLLTPDGRIARYLFGFDYTAAQLGGALDETAQSRIASPIRRLLLTCFHFDPANGRYDATIVAGLRVFAIASLLAAIAVAAVRLARVRRPLNRA